MQSAILFDLFGTLVPGGTSEQRDAVSYEAAADLGVDPDRFAARVRETYDARLRGSMGDLETTLSVIATGLGGIPSPTAVQRAARRRNDFTRDLLAATWALPVLDSFRAAGLPIGLISDCSAETPTIWPDVELSKRIDAVAFSCVLKRRKPDPRMYLTAIDQLGVQPGECVFIGDGASGELSGARSLGIRAIWFDDVDGEPTERPDHEVGWSGERITDLAALPDLLL